MVVVPFFDMLLFSESSEVTVVFCASRLDERSIKNMNGVKILFIVLLFSQAKVISYLDLIQIKNGIILNKT
jgi:hypothetical protein